MTARNALYMALVCMGVLVCPATSCTSHGQDTAVEQAMPLVKEFESLRLDPYFDSAGFPTIGYGHRLSSHRWLSLDGWKPINEEIADVMLARDLNVAYLDVIRLVDVQLTTGQKAALIDFVFNLGGHSLEASHMLFLINNEQLDQVPRELLRWVHVGKMVEPGLVRRRKAEIVLWEEHP